MLRKILLAILFFSLLASPTFSGGLNWGSRHQTNRHGKGMFFKSDFDTSRRTFIDNRLNFNKKLRGRNRIPRFIGFPFYSVYDGERYENKGEQTLTVIIEGNKKDETTKAPAKTEKSFAPPHIVTLDDKDLIKVHKAKEDAYRVVEIRGNEVTVTEILSR